MISIVIPMFNRASLIEETLDSIAAQTHTDWECIIVDDHSTDDSADVVRRYAEKDARFRLLRRPSDRLKGACACRNYGYENSVGEFVYFFDSDDLISPSLFSTVLDGFADHAEAEYVVFPQDVFTNDPSCPCKTLRKYHPKNGPLFEQIITGKTRAMSQNTLWRRALLEEMPLLWNEEHTRGQEGDFIARAICRAKQGAWLDISTLVHYRSHSDSIGGKYHGTLEEGRILLERRASLFKYCRESGKMTPELHSELMRSLLRSQIASIVLYQDKGIASNYVAILEENSDKRMKDRVRIFFSRMVTCLMRPISWACKTLAFIGVPAFRYRLLVRNRK